MAATGNCTCCGCVVVDGNTSIVLGTGSVTDPFNIEIIDPTFINDRYAVRRHKSLGFNVDNDTLTAVDFFTPFAGSFDQGGFFNPALPTRFTIPVTGVYILGGTTSWDANATGTRYMELRVNGTNILEADESNSDALSSHFVSLATTFHFSAGDYIELLVRQTSGAGLICSSTDNAPIFWAIYVGRFV